MPMFDGRGEYASSRMAQGNGRLVNLDGLQCCEEWMALETSLPGLNDRASD